ncbi:MAG: 5-formyltetrahydrofolate cyclo-ligase [Lachnospiraceae bacterium]|nr:5-formyltetrahydrofolate cyclo-ligase [Lachnospiraceae bacterium]
MTDRDELRNKYRRIRDSIEPALRRFLSGKIGERLFGLPLFKEAQSVFFYHSFGSEVETPEMIKTALSEGKLVALPRVLDDKAMRFYFVEDLESLEISRFGVPEPPKEGLCAISEPDLVIVPGLVFDREGNRLGYGKGYYDRFFKTLPYGVSKAALAFDEQLSDTVIKEEYDVPVDLIITPSEVMEI